MMHLIFQRLTDKIIQRSLLAGLLVVLTGCASQSGINNPFSTYSVDSDKKVIAKEAMVSSAHPLASEAGQRMLEVGGNAVDAAVATAFALNVVEPNMSGIGGGGSMLIWNRQNKQADYVDFYTAKRAETYKDIDYSQFEEDEFDLLSTGIPGTVDGLLQALEQHGTMSRAEVMQPAIDCATEGFPVYLTLAQFIQDNEQKLKRYKGARKTFWPDGEPLEVGEILKQPELAKTLQRISDQGASAFYKGANAEDMVEVFNEGGNPVTVKDFAQYEPQWNKAPLCGSYRDNTVLSAPLPQTGFYIIQALNILEDYDLKQLGFPTVSVEAFNVLTSSLRLSIADRAEYVTDPNWKDIPVGGLISKHYADQRRQLIHLAKAPEKVNYGTSDPLSPSSGLAECEAITFDNATAGKGIMSMDKKEHRLAVKTKAELSEVISDEAKGPGETTHISVVDPEGNAVSLSTTLSHVFGSGAWVNGFLLNNSGFNFSYLEGQEDWESTNPYRIRASTISPTIMLKDGEVRLVIGAPGGGRIPTAILQNIVYILDYELDPLDAVQMPRIFPNYSNPEVQIEKGFDNNVLTKVREMGYEVQALSKGYARLYLVLQKDGRLIGVSDPRHDGEPRGF